MSSETEEKQVRTIDAAIYGMGLVLGAFIVALAGIVLDDRMGKDDSNDKHITVFAWICMVAGLGLFFGILGIGVHKYKILEKKGSA